MKVSDFYFDLPEELIAQVPIKNRDESRLLVIKGDKIEHKQFKNIIDYLKPGDCLVINNTKVIPARIYGIKENTTTNVEFLLLKRIKNDNWEVLVRPGRRLPVGARVNFADGLLKAEIIEILPDGNRIVEFKYKGIFNEILNQIGLMPLPPYIKVRLEDKDRYQTVYAKYDGSAAAPTAGLHFTNELLEQIKQKGIEIANVTLHVRIGTFRPVKTENVEEHQMHTEHYILKKEDAEKINRAKRIVAVGTTSCRVIETLADEKGKVHEAEGDTSIFIYPGYKFKAVNTLITNFHLPESSLIMLVSALAGREKIMQAYKEAINEKYRFFSFGDAMLIDVGGQRSDDRRRSDFF